jgi:PAS domain S-box-containing protein
VKRFLLKQKIILLLVIVILFSIIIAGGVISVYINKVLTDNKKEEILYISTEQANETSLTLKNNQLFAYMISTQKRVRDIFIEGNDVKKKQLTDLFLEYIKNDEKYLALYLLDKNGIGFVSTDPRFIGQDYSFRNYFKKAVNGEHSVEVLVGKTSKQFGYYFIYPVFGEKKEVLGILILKVDENDIDAQLISNKISKNNVLMLVDEYGIIISSSESNRKLKSLGKLSEEKKQKIILENRFPNIEILPLQYDTVQKSITEYTFPAILNVYDKENDEEKIFSLIKLTEFPFYVVTEIKLGALNYQVSETVSVVLLIILIILLLIFLFLFHFLNDFLKPVDKFIEYFKNISNGDFSKRLVIKTKDEFSDMADSVNQMAINLDDLYKNLDEKVKKQTVDIENKIKDYGDQNKAILNILEDVEKEKINAENLANDLEKFKLAVDNASDQVVITDAEGIVIYGNNAVEKITGFKPEEAVGKKAAILWKYPMPVEYYKNLWDVIKNQKKVFNGEIQNKRKNGEIYTALISISSVLDKNDNIIYFVAIERDITKEKEVDKAKTEFVSLASHQLRTPLSAINWYTEMLLAGDAGSINEEQKKYLEEIAIGNKRMVDLVDDLLNVSRLDMGTFAVDLKPIKIFDLVKSVLIENKPLILEKKLVVEELYGEESDMEFLADEKLLRIIFQNLISNAVKYTPSEGKIKVNISKFNFNNDQDLGGEEIKEESLIFSVTDSGMGIPKNQHNKIFSKLFRADNAKESETEGTGLGLYVIKSIVNQSGGLVWFKSEENKGSTFYVAFPFSGMRVPKK